MSSLESQLLLLTRAMLVAMFVCPFLVTLHPSPIPSFYSEIAALLLGAGISIITLGWCLCIPNWWQNVFSFPPILVVPIGFIGIISVQYVFGYYAYAINAWLPMIYFFWAASLIVVGCVWREKMLPTLAVALMIGAILNALIGVIQAIGIPHFLIDYVLPAQFDANAGVYGNIAQQNHFATYLNLGVLSSLFLWHQKKFNLVLSLAVILVLSVGVVLSASRGGLINLLLILAVSLWVIAGAQLNKRTRRQLLVGALLVLGVLVILAYVFSFAPFERLTRLNETLGTRGMLWASAFHMFKENWLFGVGFEGFAYQLTKALPKIEIVSQWGVDQYAHNLILQLLANSGVVGGGLFLFGVVEVVRHSVVRHSVVRHSVVRHSTMLNSKPQHTETPNSPKHSRNGASVYVYSMMLVLVVHSLIEQPLVFSYFLGLFALLLGIVCPPSTLVLRSNVVRRIVVACICFVQLALIGWGIHEWRQFDRFLLVTRERDLPNQVQSLVELHRSLLLRPYLELSYPTVFYPGPYSLETKIALNTQWMRFYPSAESLFMQAVFYAELGDDDAMKMMLKRAMYAYPNEVDSAVNRIERMAQSNSVKYQNILHEAHRIGQQIKR